jgi:hypothetical protein
MFFRTVVIERNDLCLKVRRLCGAGKSNHVFFRTLVIERNDICLKVRRLCGAVIINLVSFDGNNDMLINKYAFFRKY